MACGAESSPGGVEEDDDLDRFARDLRALELPRGEAAKMQVVPTDFRHCAKSVQRISERLLASRRVKLDFQADIVAPNETVTNRAHRATYHRSAEGTHRFGYRQIADPDRLAGLLSQDLFVGHIDLHA